jgi:hypothetical protein
MMILSITSPDNPALDITPWTSWLNGEYMPYIYIMFLELRLSYICSPILQALSSNSRFYGKIAGPDSEIPV